MHRFTTRNNNKTFLLVLLVTIFCSSSQALSLEKYLSEVSKNNDEYQSNQILEQSGFVRSEEGFLMLSPNLTGNLSYVKDKQPQLFVTTSPNTKIENYDVGVTKKFSTGTNVKLGYDNSYVRLEDHNTQFVVHSRTWFIKPSISIEQSLLRDLFGTETKALINLKNSQAKAQGHFKKFSNQKILADAESTYWDMAAVLTNIRIKHDAIGRANKLLEWAKRRLDLGLATDSDYFQAKAALEQHQLQLQSIVQAQKNAAVLFNAFMTVSSNEMPNKLETFSIIDLNKIKPKDPLLPPGIREDLKLEYQNYLTADARATVAKQNIYPDVNFRVKYYPTGSGVNFGTSTSNAWQGKRESVNVGLSFNMPLDVKLMRDLHDAYKSESYAAELAYIRKKFEVGNEWRRLADQFNLLLNQVKTAKSLAETQRKKLQYESGLLKNGRTTTFQVIQFEQDYFNSQSQYIDLKTRLLKLSALLKLFN